MKAHCRQCRATIPVENISVETDVAVCQQCGEITSLSSLVATVLPMRDSIPTSFDIYNVPSGAWYHGTPERFTVGATTRCLPALLFLVPFTIVWAGGSMTGIYGSQILQGKFNPVLSLFGLPFLAGSILLVGTTLMSAAGKVVVVVSSGEGTVFTGVAGVGWTRRFQWDEVDSVVSDVSNANRRRAQSAIALEGATRVRFGTELSEARRFYMLNALRTLKAARR